MEAELLIRTHLSHSTAQRVSKAVGDQLSRDWQAKEDPLWSEKLPDPERTVKMLQTTMDGVMVFVGKQWREERDDNGGVARAS